MEDIDFWQVLIAERVKGKKVRFLPFVRMGEKRITGKSYIMKHSSQANPNYVLCVDSDFDYILGRENFDAEHYILQTYTYSWENHHCWDGALQAEWENWRDKTAFDFTAFLVALSTTIYETFVIMLTKKRLSHKGLTLDAMCNAIDSVQGNQKDLLQNNGEGVLQRIKINIDNLLERAGEEPAEELQVTIQRLEELGVTATNCYLYMQGHSIYNLVSRIGKALLNESFEYQVLRRSFSVDNSYSELNHIKADIRKVVRQG